MAADAPYWPTWARTFKVVSELFHSWLLSRNSVTCCQADGLLFEAVNVFTWPPLMRMYSTTQYFGLSFQPSPDMDWPKWMDGEPLSLDGRLHPATPMFLPIVALGTAVAEVDASFDASGGSRVRRAARPSFLEV